jgi:vancomycin aglycone glucosyltransferase
VVVPLQLADNPYWAGQVAALDLGAALDSPAPTTESLNVAFKTALAPETQARAKALGSRIRTDGAAVAANLLLEAIR